MEMIPFRSKSSLSASDVDAVQNGDAQQFTNTHSLPIRKKTFTKSEHECDGAANTKFTMIPDEGEEQTSSQGCRFRPKQLSVIGGHKAFSNSDDPKIIYQQRLELRTLLNNYGNVLAEQWRKNFEESRSQVVFLMDLPTEMHLEIIHYLPYKPALQLSMTNKHFQSIVPNIFDKERLEEKRDWVVKHARLLNKQYRRQCKQQGREVPDGYDQEYRSCWRCFRVLHRSEFGGIMHPGASNGLTDLCLRCDFKDTEGWQFHRGQFRVLPSGRHIRFCNACGCAVSQYDDHTVIMRCPCLPRIHGLSLKKCEYMAAHRFSSISEVKIRDLPVYQIGSKEFGHTSFSTKSALCPKIKFA